MKIRMTKRRNQGLALAIWLAIAAIAVVAGIAIIAYGHQHVEVQLFGARLSTDNLFFAGFFVIVVGVVAGIRAWRNRKSDAQNVTVTNSKNVVIGSSSATAGDTHHAPPPPRTRYMGDD